MRRNDDLELNAYVDGELTAEEQAEILTAMQRNPELAKEACELNNLKNQLKLAYENPPGISSSSATPNKTPWYAIAASLVMLAMGLAGGFWMGTPANHSDRFVMLDADGRGQAPSTIDSPETRIVFHLTSDPEDVAAEELLDDIEDMLSSYKKDGNPLRVEIVSHGKGLSFMRERLSHHKARIHELATTYKNLTFVACKNTIDRLQVEQGVEIKIVPEAEVIDSGVSHVVKRQKEGWSYIRV